jgi:RNA polymerase sigma factor (sigma-70 family)
MRATTHEGSLIMEPSGTERDLLERIGRGDRDAGQEVVNRYRGLIAAAARRVLFSSADVDDVVQETFFILLVSSARIRQPERLGPWLWTTATNLARRTARRNDRLRPVDDANLRSDVDLGLDEDFDRDLEREQDSEALHEALASISAEERRLIGMLTVEDRPCYLAISEAVHRPIGSLGPTRRRILTKLRQHPAMERLAVAAA